MKHLPATSLALAALLACTGCGQAANPFSPSYWHSTSPQPVQAQKVPSQNSAPGASMSYASDEGGCSTQAKNRLAMFDRPSTYPISDSERNDGYQALYSECMREHNWQVAGPAHSPITLAGANGASQFAALSPAAGGPAPGQVMPAVNTGSTIVSSSSVPGATVLVIGGNSATDAAALSSLSPSAGGNSAYPANATVVLVQSQPAVAAATPAGYYPAAALPPAAGGPLPVAVPVAPALAAYQPVKSQAPVTPAAAATAMNNYQPMPSVAPPAAPTPASPMSAQKAAANQQLESVVER
jgi:hypothetical protein